MGADYARTVSETTIAGHAGAVHVRTWEHPDPRRVVVLVHGYGEHLGRYEHVAATLVERGAEVWALDHAGHGRSEGERALLLDLDGAVADLHQVVACAREARPQLPVAMVAHSMGGALGTRHGELHPGELAGLVLSAPVLGTWAPALQMVGLDDMPEVPIDPATLSRDPAVGEAYAADPLVYHGPIRRATVGATVNALLELALDADRVTGPVLWQHGADDELVPVEGTRRGIALLRNADVEERIYPGARHEIFNEVNRDEVLADTAAFLERVTAATLIP
jgi:alpha-beta hydrolase superfamily lysophospholipase